MESIRIERLKQRISQWDMANKTGILQSRISLIENNHVIPKENELKQISKALEIPTNELQSGPDSL